MTANDNKSYLSYLNKVLDQYNNTYYSSIGENPLNAHISALTEKNWEEFSKFKVNDSTRITKFALKIGLGKYLLLILFWKLILGFIKLKI